MRITGYLLVCIFSLTQFNAATAFNQRVLERQGKIFYLSNEILVKFKAGAALPQNGVLPGYLFKSGRSAKIIAVKKIFEAEPASVATGRIFSLYFEGNADPFIIARKLFKEEQVEWAEPRFVYKTTHVPNDLEYGNQWGLKKINAEGAWDVTKGDTSVVIGIIDTGVDWDHPDLALNIWRNKGEIPNNGIDDDNNGYIDDVRGWDFGGVNGVPDNNPMEDKPDHGTHVAGIASACTNNGIGIAGIGYQCKIMPVKASQDNFRGDNGAPYIVYGYDGILYAAKNGCKVINCSWGGYGYSSFGEEVVNRATVLGALVVAAAGNDNTQDAHYPSSFHKALSVASTSSGDMKSAFSNYGTGVDVCSPGEAILSTWMNDTYYYNNGTSMASPLAAGLAGLVAARFPSFTAEQIREQIRVTCDNIAPMNPGLRGQIGSGRINARNAVSNTAAVSVRTNDIIADDSAGDNDGVIEPGETIKLKITFTNYLRPISAMNIGLESTSPYAEVIVSNYFPGSIGEYVSFTNTDHPYTVKIAPNTPYNTRLTFVLNYINGGTIAEEAFSLLANPSYATQKGNDISLTITSKGNFGFADYPDNLQGDGFRYKNSGNLLFEGAIIMGTSASKLSNSARNANQGKAQDADFTTLLPFTIIQPGNAADVEGSTVMNDNGNPSGGMGLELHTNTYTYTTAGNENYIILRNRIRNTTTGSISNFYFGLYTDWDMTSSGGDDYTQFDALGKLGYCYHTVGTGNIYTATALLTNSSPLYWGILNDGGDGGFSIYDGFSDQEKWTALGGGKDRAGAGDVSFVLGTGPFSIAAGKTIDIAFALCAGNTIQELRDAAAKAAVKYQAMNPGIPPASYAFALSQNYPNPFNSGTKIDFQLEAQGWTEIKLYDFLGRFISTVFSGELDAGTYSVPFAAGTLSSGIYFYELVSSGNSATRKMIVLR